MALLKVSSDLNMEFMDFFSTFAGYYAPAVSKGTEKNNKNYDI